MATNPTASRFTVDNIEEIRTTGSGGGGGGNVNITGINGSPPALSNPLPVELSDGTNSVGTPGNPLSVNVISGGGANASVGANNAVAPTSSTQIGSIDGSGKLQAASTANPIPVSVITSLLTDPAEGIPGGAPPAKAIQVAGSDGSALRTVLTDSQCRLQIAGSGSSTTVSPVYVDVPPTAILFDVLTAQLSELRALRILFSIMAAESGQAYESDFDPLNFSNELLEFMTTN